MEGRATAFHECGGGVISDMFQSHLCQLGAISALPLQQRQRASDSEPSSSVSAMKTALLQQFAVGSAPDSVVVGQYNEFRAHWLDELQQSAARKAACDAESSLTAEEHIAAMSKFLPHDSAVALLPKTDTTYARMSLVGAGAEVVLESGKALHTKRKVVEYSLCSEHPSEPASTPALLVVNISGRDDKRVQAQFSAKDEDLLTLGQLNSGGMWFGVTPGSHHTSFEAGIQLCTALGGRWVPFGTNASGSRGAVCIGLTTEAIARARGGVCVSQPYANIFVDVLQGERDLCLTVEMAMQQWAIVEDHLTLDSSSVYLYGAGSTGDKAFCRCKREAAAVSAKQRLEVPTPTATLLPHLMAPQLRRARSAEAA